MHTVKDLVTQERNRLEAAFRALENSIETYLNQLPNGQASQPEQSPAAPQQPVMVIPVSGNDNSEVLSQIQDIVKNHERKIVELKEEIGRLSVELVRLKDENRALKDQNKQAAELIGESITAIEKLVAA